MTQPPAACGTPKGHTRHFAPAANMRVFQIAVAFVFALTATSTTILLVVTITDPPASPVLIAARLVIVALIVLGWVRIYQLLRRL